MVTPVRRVNRPCDECPWRKDAFKQRFPQEKFEALRESAGTAEEQANIDALYFACHKSPNGLERACAGWLAVAGQFHIGVRLAVVLGRLPEGALWTRDDWPELYEDFDEMVNAQDYES